MTMNRIILGIAGVLAITTTYGAIHQDNLENAREAITKRYISDLGRADYKDIVQLFEQNGVVVSTSRGKVDAKEFFYGFLPNILSAKTVPHQSFRGSTDKNRFTVRFNFSFKLKDGDEGAGEYIDEFVFAKNSAKLAAVYMFENHKFPKTESCEGIHG